MPIALLSVSDKTGLVDFARGLHDLGWRLLASGSTAQVLRQAQLPVQEVAEYTGMPELLEGRVKTLHPAIHAGILARDTAQDRMQLQQMQWEYIDLVAVNLYPFAQTIAKSEVTLAEAIEHIDIGGPTLLRAAAKNFQRVIVVNNPADYVSVLEALRNDTMTLSLRKKLAAKVFALTQHYDATIQDYLMETPTTRLTLYPQPILRYGENPHQQATLYSYQPDTGPLGGWLLQGKALSYNNLLDLDAAWCTVKDLAKPAVCIVKHLTPCGVACAATVADAFSAALASDPISAFGGIIASNRAIDAQTVQAFGDLFIEAIAAPDFTPDALTLLAKRVNCRLLQIPLEKPTKSALTTEWRSIQQGLLQQEIDRGDPANTEWRVVTQRQPTEAEWLALRFAWHVCQYVKSNAIVLAQGEATVGVGGGQPNRIDCVRIAAQRAGTKVHGSVMASDAFFPFADGVQLAGQSGITAVIQPGGAKRDVEVIAAADQQAIAMIFTGVRHFRH